MRKFHVFEQTSHISSILKRSVDKEYLHLQNVYAQRESTKFYEKIINTVATSQNCKIGFCFCNSLLWKLPAENSVVSVVYLSTLIFSHKISCKASRLCACNIQIGNRLFWNLHPLGKDARDFCWQDVRPGVLDALGLYRSIEAPNYKPGIMCIFTRPLVLWVNFMTNGLQPILIVFVSISLFIYLKLHQ